VRAFLVTPGAARRPARRTFASALRALAHSEPAALRHPAFACRLRRLTGRRAAPSPGRCAGVVGAFSGDARGCPSPRSPDVRFRLPAFSSLGAGCAPASCLRLPPTPSHGATGSPFAGLVARCRSCVSG